MRCVAQPLNLIGKHTLEGDFQRAHSTSFFHVYVLQLGKRDAGQKKRAAAHSRPRG
jgi:hypothetical protein